MNAHLPMSRIRTIIKSSADVDFVSKDSAYIITRAAELFIKQLAREAYEDANGGKEIDYKNVANIVNAENHYEFLREIIPKKITVAEYLKLTKEPGVAGESEPSSSEEESSSDDDNSSDNEKISIGSTDSDVIILN